MALDGDVSAAADRPPNCSGRLPVGLLIGGLLLLLLLLLLLMLWTSVSDLLCLPSADGDDIASVVTLLTLGRGMSNRAADS